MIAWNEFLFALLFLVERRDNWTVSLGLSQLSGSIEVPTTVLMAGSVILTLPDHRPVLPQRALAGRRPHRRRREGLTPYRRHRHRHHRIAQEENRARDRLLRRTPRGRAGRRATRSHWCPARCGSAPGTPASRPGTELTAYRGSNPYLTSTWDAERRLFVEGAPTFGYPVEGWGYSEVGRGGRGRRRRAATRPGLRRRRRARHLGSPERCRGAGRRGGGARLERRGPRRRDLRPGRARSP